MKSMSRKIQFDIPNFFGKQTTTFTWNFWNIHKSNPICAFFGPFTCSLLAGQAINANPPGHARRLAGGLEKGTTERSPKRRAGGDFFFATQKYHIYLKFGKFCSNSGTETEPSKKLKNYRIFNAYWPPM